MIKFSQKEVVTKLKKFLEIYENRPIKNNINGMKINHMFAFYFLLT